MSKQLKYKLKKTLKKAEFVHADLEYHKELSGEAIKGFQDEVNRLVDLLTDEQKKEIQRFVDEHVAQKRAVKAEKEASAQNTDPIETSDCTDIVCTDLEPEPNSPNIGSEEGPTKIHELKKLFRRIAEQTHPDKVRASGFSDKEVARLEQIFMRAKVAYDHENWYILYSIALDLGLEIPDPSNLQIQWIEDDIHQTLGRIAKVAQLTAWQWYIGNELQKNMALKHFFMQSYGFDHPDL